MPLASRGAADRLARQLDAGTPVPGDPALALALQLRATGAALGHAVAPRPEFRAALRTRLVAVATVQGAATAGAASPEPVNARHAAVSLRAGTRAPRRSRGPLVAAGATACVVAVSGIAVAGSQSLPGEPFYGVKTATESLQLRMAGDDVDTGTQHLERAATRLREIRALTLGRDAALAIGSAGSGRPLALAAPDLAGDLDDEVRDTLARMDASTREGTELLTGAFRETRATEPVLTLSRFAERQSAGLAELLPSLPAASQERARSSLALVSGVAEQAGALLATGTCTAACDPSAAAPQLPGAPRSSPSGPAAQECGCPSPSPAPPAVPGSTPLPVPPPGTDPVAPRAPGPATGPDAPASTKPSPSPSPTAGTAPPPVPAPLPLPPVPDPVPPVPVPDPVPLPTSPDGVGEVVDDVVDAVGGVLDPLLP